MKKWFVKVSSFLIVASIGPIAACTAASTDEESTESTEQAQSRRQKPAGSASGSGSAAAPKPPAADARCGKFDFATNYRFQADYQGDAPPMKDDDIIGEKQAAEIEQECVKKIFDDPKFDPKKTPLSNPQQLRAECGTCPAGKSGCTMTNVRTNLSIETFMDGDTEKYRCHVRPSREGNPNDGYTDVYHLYLQYDCTACLGPGCTPAPSATPSGPPKLTPLNPEPSASASASGSASGSGSASAPAPSGSSTSGR